MNTNSLKAYNHQDSELKAHSSALTNERIAGLIAMFDESMILANRTLDIKHSLDAVVYLKEIWKSFRPNVFNDPFCRRDLRLETKVDGIYYPDIILRKLYVKCIYYQNNTGQITPKRIVQLNELIEEVEESVRNTLQFFQFTFRLQKKQKPDIAWVNKKIIDTIDEYTEKELYEMAGKRMKKVQDARYDESDRPEK